ncbi:hypothetical protein FRB95_011825 [Tulasnella sp. JGI-2019a]|nr:hypothetical protein FRB93_000291 [Tulasnella sp. JGI-2019a]KAG9039240.1 hypothetical protein FRB95_011825 [Tulasnella sp. JGI-2019a]
MANTDSAAASYIIERIGQDISFLAHHGHLTREDEAAIRQHLSKANKSPSGQQPRSPFVLPPVSMPGLQQSMPTPTTPNGNLLPRHFPPNAQPAAGPSSANGNGPQTGKKPEFCKANWPYNADGTEAADLSFRKGDIIEIVEETNADWWTGITRGRTGLFPSNHAIKIPYDPHLFPTPPESVNTPPSAQRPSPMGMEKTMFPPPMYGQPGPPPGTLQAPVIVQGGQEQKPNSKFKKTGSQLGNAMVSGFGFGAGAAIAGDIVNSIL